MNSPFIKVYGHLRGSPRMRIININPIQVGWWRQEPEEGNCVVMGYEGRVVILDKASSEAWVKHLDPEVFLFDVPTQEEVKALTSGGEMPQLPENVKNIMQELGFIDKSVIPVSVDNTSKKQLEKMITDQYGPEAYAAYQKLDPGNDVEFEEKTPLSNPVLPSGMSSDEMLEKTMLEASNDNQPPASGLTLKAVQNKIDDSKELE